MKTLFRVLKITAVSITAITLGLSGISLAISHVLAVDVTVTATVGASVSCNVNTGSTAFSTLTTGSVTAATPNVTSTITTNDGLGFTLSIRDTGLATSSPAYTIASTTGALSAGVEGYGIQATTTAGGTGTLTINAIYKVSGNDVGAMKTTDTVLASSTAAVTSKNILVTHKAAISSDTQAGSYSDTITYSCTGN
ncbi:MAG: hypothetical protein V1489_02810 [Candidatus Liptonbacteria bacterium]